MSNFYILAIRLKNEYHKHISWIKTFFKVWTIWIVERDPSWDLEIKEDVVEECNKHGGVQHIYVDKASSQVCILIQI